MKEKNIAYIRKYINRERVSTFDKYFIKTLLELGNVDVYIENPPPKIPDYLFNKNYGKINIIKFKSFGNTLFTYFHVFFKIKKIENKYDHIISDDSFFNVGNGLLDSKKSIIYYHSPERSFYDLYHYRLKFKNFFQKIVQLIGVYTHRPIDNYVISNTKNTKILTNSNNVSTRIYSVYKKYSQVVYPISDLKNTTIKDFSQKKVFDKYYLLVSRFDIPKRIEIAVNVFKKLENKNLILVGRGGTEKYFNDIKSLCSNSKNIIILEKINDSDLVYLYKNCEAVIQPALNEDFGIVPLEAMEVGTPVIAVAEGGYQETVINNITGITFIQPYEENLINIINNFDKNIFDKEKIKKYYSDNFSYDIFKKKLSDILYNNN